eukprot:6312087-Ditylum_brightwellii.AAC.1
MSILFLLSYNQQKVTPTDAMKKMTMNPNTESPRVETIAKTVTSLANSALFQSRELKVLGAKQASLIWAISGDTKNLQNDGISDIASLSTQI